MPKTLSATSLKVAMGCMARFEAEFMNRAKGGGSIAANLGTAVHGALEMFVKSVYLEKISERSEKLLLDMFELSYYQVFGKLNKNSEEYRDGVEMLKRWYFRADLEQPGRTVISCESKTNFPLTLDKGAVSVPFTYIWDRFDQTGENEFTVVDYKTNRWNKTTDDLREDVQVRGYGLAAQIAHPNAERIWVELDMLRHDGPIAVLLTKEDNAATWLTFRKELRRILDTPEGSGEEKLNPECVFCVRKTTCSKVALNIKVGGVHSLTEEQLVDLRADLSFQEKAIKAAMKEIDELFVEQAKANDQFEFSGAHNNVSFGMSSRREVDGERVQMVLGPQLWSKYGSQNILISTIDDLLKGSELTPEQKADLRSLIVMKRGQPTVKVKHKTAMSDI